MVDLACDSPERSRAGGATRAGPGRAVTGAVVAAVGALVALQLGALVASRTSPRLLALDAGVAVVGLAAVPVLLRRPVRGALALAVFAGLSPAATPLSTVGAFHVAQWRRFRVAAGVAAAGAAAHVVRGLWRPTEGLAFGWWVVLVLVAHATLVGWGAFAQARRALLASLRERARRAESEQSRRVAEARVLERARIAREMHDVLAHRLSLVATYAGAIEYRPDAPPERLAAAAGVVRAGVRQALDELREVVTLLRDDDPAGDGGLRPQPTLVDLPRLVEECRAAGMGVCLDTTGTDLAAVPVPTGRTAYRVVQEGMTNARKHAPGQPVRVAVRGRAGAALDVEVRNPLPEPGTAVADATGTGTGLVGLAERVQLAGGELEHDRGGAEFRLRACLPWPA